MVHQPCPKQKPFLRWVGGKQRLVKTLLANVPPFVADTDATYTYYEPFIGAGSLLLALQPKKAVIGDVNKELVNTYQVLKTQPSLVPQLQAELESYENNEDYYYHVRDEMDVGTMTPVQRAARFIYLNRTCYAGLYRENRSGVFNVSYGKNEKSKHDSMTDILPVAKYLQEADITIVNGDFAETVASAKEGDFVYLDPPYYPVTNTSFTSYHNGSGFDYNALYNTFMDLTDRGCYVLMSESDCEHNREVYSKYILGELTLGKTIRPELSKARQELLICNYNDTSDNMDTDQAL